MSAAEVTTLLRCTNAFVQRNNVVTSAAWRPLVANVVQSSDLSSCRGVRDELSLTTRHDDRSLDCTTFAARGPHARHHVTRHSAATSPAPNSRASCPPTVDVRTAIAMPAIPRECAQMLWEYCGNSRAGTDFFCA